MSYAQFGAVGGISDWIAKEISAVDGEKAEVDWVDVTTGSLEPVRKPLYPGTPEYQLNQAAYYYLNDRSGEAKEITLKLVPELKGRMRGAIARQLLTRCGNAE